MKPKSVVALILGLFVIAALVLIARQAITPPVTTSTSPEVAAVQQAIVTPASPRDAKSRAVQPAVDSSASAPAAISAEAAPSADSTPPERRVEKRSRVEPANDAAGTPGSLPRSTHKVIAMYFHGDVRCRTCRTVEAYAREAVESGFAEQIATGTVEFRAVNIDQPGNRHFIEDYQLTNKSVVVVDEQDGSVARWVKLDNVWGLVGNREAYFTYVQDAVRAYVEN